MPQCPCQHYNEAEEDCLKVGVVAIREVLWCRIAAISVAEAVESSVSVQGVGPVPTAFGRVQTHCIQYPRLIATSQNTSHLAWKVTTFNK